MSGVIYYSKSTKKYIQYVYSQPNITFEEPVLLFQHFINHIIYGNSVEVNNIEIINELCFNEEFRVGYYCVATIFFIVKGIIYIPFLNYEKYAIFKLVRKFFMEEVDCFNFVYRFPFMLKSIIDSQNKKKKSLVKNYFSHIRKAISSCKLNIDSSACNNYSSMSEYVTSNDNKIEKIYPIFDSDVVTYENIEYVIDIDSVLYTTRTLDIYNYIKIFPTPSMTNNLFKSNHIYVYHDKKRISLHSIPHWLFGTSGLDGSIYILIMFPNMIELRNGRYVNFVKRETQREFYNNILRPTLEHILPIDEIYHYPKHFDIHISACTAANGQFKHLGYYIREKYFTELISYMRSLIDNQEKYKKFKNFLFHIYSKNLKLISKEKVYNIKNISIFLQRHGFKIYNTESLYIDIGIEIYLKKDAEEKEKNTLVWNLPSLVSVSSSLGLTHRRRLDYFCHSGRIGGMASEALPSHSRLHGIAFFQAYLCEKNVVASNGRFSNITGYVINILLYL